ncbi:hypothetical protein DFH07DRAFT_790802 [Mycena maculata]|uniref:Secreted protein n=1 Tax=Mycena maculata TaxID=230809 RepID=A0AAD7KDE3_9AGAR|nr:hypothetical protein DFH07DRAFT_790802 [Mycena maculata]
MTCSPLLSFSPFLAVATQLESVGIWADIFSKASTWACGEHSGRRHFNHSYPSEDFSSICSPTLRELILSHCGAFSDAALPY